MNAIWRKSLISSSAMACVLIGATLAPSMALAQERTYRFDIAAKPLAAALTDYGRTTGVQLLFSQEVVGLRRAPAVSGARSADAALAELLAGSGLTSQVTPSGTIMIVAEEAGRPQPGLVTAVAPTLDEVVVTGSHIRGGDAIAQVIELGSADIERGGFLDLGQALRSLPVNFSGGLNPETSVGNVLQDGAGDNGFHASGANLYGLGSGATLVLLNGHRLPVMGSGVSVDMSLVPLAAVERMEILADGASAIYGADAVAGVVNIITKRSMEGGEARIRYGGAKDGLDTWAGSVVTGGTWNTLSGLVGVEHVAQNSLASAKRKASRDHIQPQTLFGDTNRTSYFGSATWAAAPGVEFVGDAVYLQRAEGGIQSSGVSSTNLGRYEVEEYAVHGGVKADLWADWILDVSATKNGNTGKYDTADVSKLTGIETPGAPVRRRNELWSVEANLAGSILALPAGPLRAAFGAAYREESLTSLVERESAGREVSSAYGEIEAPLIGPENGVPGVETLTLSLAGRVDDYSDFGSKAVPKLAVLWRITPELTARATISRSFRAPSMYELTRDYFVSILDARDSQSPTGLTRIGYVGGTGRPLGPETADNFNATLNYEPSQAPGLKASLSYYDVKYDNRLAAPDPSFAYATNISSAPAALLTRNPSQAEVDALLAAARGYRVYSPNPAVPIGALIDARSTNVASTHMSGFSAAVSYARAFDTGSLSVSWDANYLTRFDEQLLPSAPPASRVDTIFSPADLRMRTGLVWSDDDWSAAAYWNYVDNYLDNRTSTPAKVSAYSTFDANLTYAFGSTAPTALRGARVIFSATNLFDAPPPETAPAAITNYRWDATNASIVGRFLSVELVKSW